MRIDRTEVALFVIFVYNHLLHYQLIYGLFLQKIDIWHSVKDNHKYIVGSSF